MPPAPLVRGSNKDTLMRLFNETENMSQERRDDIEVLGEGRRSPRDGTRVNSTPKKEGHLG